MRRGVSIGCRVYKDIRAPEAGSAPLVRYRSALASSSFLNLSNEVNEAAMRGYQCLDIGLDRHPVLVPDPSQSAGARCGRRAGVSDLEALRTHRRVCLSTAATPYFGSARIAIATALNWAADPSVTS